MSWIVTTARRLPEGRQDVMRRVEQVEPVPHQPPGESRQLRHGIAGGVVVRDLEVGGQLREGVAVRRGARRPGSGRRANPEACRSPRGGCGCRTRSRSPSACARRCRSASRRRLPGGFREHRGGGPRRGLPGELRRALRSRRATRRRARRGDRPGRARSLARTPRGRAARRKARRRRPPRAAPPRWSHNRDPAGHGLQHREGRSPPRGRDRRRPPPPGRGPRGLAAGVAREMDLSRNGERAIRSKRAKSSSRILPRARDRAPVRAAAPEEVAGGDQGLDVLARLERAEIQDVPVPACVSPPRLARPPARPAPARTPESTPLGTTRDARARLRIRATSAPCAVASETQTKRAAFSAVNPRGARSPRASAASCHSGMRQRRQVVNDGHEGEAGAHRADRQRREQHVRPPLPGPPREGRLDPDVPGLPRPRSRSRDRAPRPRAAAGA